jgi:hypothetical protein
MIRTLQFEPLEQRVAMSAGSGHASIAAVAAHELVVIKEGSPAAPSSLGSAEVRAGMSTTLAHPSAVTANSQKSATIKGNMSGGQSSLIPGTDTVAMGGFRGKLGKTPLQAAIYGTVSGNRLLSGSLHLFNSQGDILADLGPGTLVKKGKYDDVKVEFEFYQGTGAYTQVSGWAGTATVELKTGKSTSKAATPDYNAYSWDGDFAILQLLLDSYLKKLAMQLFEF